MRYTTAAARPRDPDDFVMTETAEDILRSLDLIRAMNGTAMTMISGAPGVGKTQAIRRFCSGLGYDALYYTVASGEGRPFPIGETILSGFYGTSAAGKSLPSLRDMLAAYIGARRILVLDEAQYLTKEGAEWVRILAEQGGSDLALVGDLALANLVGNLPQLQSRMRRPVVIREAAIGDVAAMVADTSFATPEAIATLWAVARLRGGLRNVENVVRMARLFAGASHPTLAHLKAAIVDMKLGPKEVQ